MEDEDRREGNQLQIPFPLVTEEHLLKNRTKNRQEAKRAQNLSLLLELKDEVALTNWNNDFRDSELYESVIYLIGHLSEQYAQDKI